LTGSPSGDAAVEADVARLVADHPPELRAIEDALRREIRAAAPTIVERIDFGNRLIAFGWSMAMRDLLFAIICHRDWVNVQFADGADLPDPDGLVEGTGKRIRHVKVRTIADVARPALRRLVRAQIERRPAT
jgi:hypothetical protein